MRHRRSRALLKRATAATVAVFAASILTAPAVGSAEPARPGAPPKPGGVALTWAPTHMSLVHDYSRARAIRIAKRHDLVTAAPAAFGDHVRAMRRANPDLTILAYENGTLAKEHKVRHLRESAFAHDSDGRRITSRIWGSTLMSNTSPVWQRWVDGECRDRVAMARYDGCLMDSMGLGIFSPDQKFTGIPVNPSTGVKYTQRQYRKAQAEHAAALRARSPGLVHVFNVVSNDYRYWRDPVQSRPLALGLPAVLMENFLRGSATDVGDFPDRAQWLRNVAVIRDLEKHNVAGLFSVKLWVDHTDAQAARWQAYGMASFLMAAKGNSYFVFTRSRDRAGATGANAPYSMPNRLGPPEGEMVRTGNGIYKRRFRNGLAFVNPGSQTVRVRLPSALRRLDGSTVTSFRLPPKSGEVVVEPR
ncbi:putative glycoside hydrolase [Nocardioides bizhenqiangii]|uniref:Glycoside hydrolase n=1 Tax=Nocardioides bizhenqiangii TaxID=3095076 RepID=A0ABZ0ZNT8_9ACTN|nr:MULTISPECIES: putative glycoside hydrolase [unclassified Nocardioides]MDZ5621537.1 putative glycoside hydrolase [Nocardioides sp. HM23]WQQ25626.1 putative glycoside hydrolase [Nocardioides sp. HM61]